MRKTTLTIAALAALLVTAAPAAATFPGRNGLLAYGDLHGVHVVRPDGTHDRIVSRVGPARDADWGRRGHRIAFGRGGSIWVVNLNTGTTRRVTNGRYDSQPTWSPNGGAIAYVRYGGPSQGVWVLRLSDGRKTRIVSRPAFGVDWSPDGQWIAYSGYVHNPTDGYLDSSDVYLVRPTGLDDHVLAAFPDGAGQPLAGQLSWAPDASELAVNTEANAAACDGCETLYTVNADGSGLKAVSKEGIGDPFYSPDGELLAYCSFGYTPPRYEPFRQQQALVHHGDRFVGPTCGESWQARP